MSSTWNWQTSCSGGSDAGHLLREAVSAGLFISPLGGDPCRYRYHQLFRELLHALLADDPSFARVLHSRAGTWYEKAGDFVAAVEQFVRSRDLDRAFGILHEHVAHDWFANSPADFEPWLDRIASEDIRGHRGRMLDYAIALGLAGKVEEQGRWLALAAECRRRWGGSRLGCQDGSGQRTVARHPRRT